MAALSKFLSAAVALTASVTIAVHMEGHPHQQRQKSIVNSGHGHFVEAATAAGGMAVASYVASEVASARSSLYGQETKTTDGTSTSTSTTTPGLSSNAKEVIRQFQAVRDATGTKAVTLVSFVADASSIGVASYGSGGRISTTTIGSPEISSFVPSDIFSKQVWADVSDLNFLGNFTYVISIIYERFYFDEVRFTINGGNVTLADSPLADSNSYRRQLGRGQRFNPDPDTFTPGTEYRSFDLFFDAIKPWMCGDKSQDANTWFNCTSLS